RSESIEMGSETRGSRFGLDRCKRKRQGATVESVKPFTDADRSWQFSLIGATLLQLNNAALKGNGNGFGAIGNSELGEDVFQMIFDRVPGDVQHITDFFVG